MQDSPAGGGVAHEAEQVIANFHRQMNRIIKKIKQMISDLPDNPQIVRISTSPHCLATTFKALGQVWSPEYHDFKWQYKKVIEVLEQHSLKTLDTLVKTGKYQEPGHLIKFHPDVIRGLKNILWGETQMERGLLKWERISGSARFPGYVYGNDTEFDLYAAEETSVLLGKTTTIPTRLKVSVPTDHEVRMEPIAGLPVTIAARARQASKGRQSGREISITVIGELDILVIKEGDAIAKGALRPPQTEKPARPE